MLVQQKHQIIALFEAALAPIVAGSGLAPTVTLERPRDPTHGDVACNIAMQLAKPLKKNPRELAQALVAAVRANPASTKLIDSIDIAGPGFINLRLTQAARQAVVTTVLEEGALYGKSREGAGSKVLVEFVSANPTGPLHVGHGRQGALGDALSALFESQGHEVTREFYYNDAGVQIATLANSVQARARGLKPGDTAWPENAYNGEYIAEIARDFQAGKTVGAKDGVAVTATGDVGDLESIRHFAVAYLRHEQDLDLQAFGVRFDNYYLESSLYTEGKVAHTVDTLTRGGHTYEQDGALWLRTTDHGDDKDRVMKKSDGTFTYFVPDVAYHITKWQRGFHKVINVQGSDHHGTIARVRAGLQCMDIGIPKGYPDYVLHKMVTVMKDGVEVKISKRAGSYVTLRDLIEWSAGEDAVDAVATADKSGAADPEQTTQAVNVVNTVATSEADSVDKTVMTPGERDLTRGRDAVRFFLISRKADTEFIFDVDLALARSDENPVYYVQYAHARICSVLGQWGGDESAINNMDLSLLTSAREAALLAKLAEYPDVLQKALLELGPHQVAFYLRELAGELHSYYNAERVLVDDQALRLARLALLLATRQVLRNGLGLIGVSTPARM
ncbi:MAG: argS [Herminiimonas sp.]|nr:argS [Herminiimonas sp.]